jgi:hypothetical protein
METPLAIVRASSRMLPRLEAEESLLATQRTAVGTGSLSKDDRQAVVRRWARQVDIPATQAVRTKDPGALAAMGIGLRQARRKGKHRG